MAVALGLSAPTVAIKDDPAARRFGAAKLEARVTNTGGINDQFNLDILDLPPGWFTRSKPSSRLFPGDNDLFTIEFHPPRTPEATAGPHPFKVRATPQEQPDQLVEYSVTLDHPPLRRHDDGGRAPKPGDDRRRRLPPAPAQRRQHPAHLHARPRPAGGARSGAGRRLPERRRGRRGGRARHDRARPGGDARVPRQRPAARRRRPLARRLPLHHPGDAGPRRRGVADAAAGAADGDRRLHPAPAGAHRGDGRARPDRTDRHAARPASTPRSPSATRTAATSACGWRRARPAATTRSSWRAGATASRSTRTARPSSR